MSLFMIVSLLIMCLVINAQDIRDGSNMLVCKIDSDGTVHNNCNGYENSDRDTHYQNFRKRHDCLTSIWQI